ncbi:MAG TPA: isoprenylcysteine carboxylmethyltransferase family protein [Gemmatimonadales bacterium]|nr:isoprenylcysteine carboxylmethyltransferase family protein [Gemmatimonadales bacterium]
MSEPDSPPARDTAGVIAPPPLIYLVPLVAGLLLDRRAPIGGIPSGPAQLLGTLCLMGFSVAVFAVVAFHRAGTRPEPWKPTTALVTSGPYRFTRNPMYLGFTLLYLALALWFGGYWTLLLLPPVLAVMIHGVIRREEAYLSGLFGAEYDDYRQRVRRWL